MYTVLSLYLYRNDRWEVITAPGDMLMSDITQQSRVAYVAVKDNLDVMHLVTFADLISSGTVTDTLQERVDTLVLNCPITEEPTFSTSLYQQISDAELVNGIVKIKELTPYVFNTTKAFLTEAFDGGRMVLDYLDDVSSSNDVVLGTFDNIKDFKLMHLTDLTMENLDAALLVMGDVLVKASDYFKTLGNDLIIRPYRSMSIVGLLIEAGFSPSEFGIYGPYTNSSFVPRRIMANLIKHPAMRVLVHPYNRPIDIVREVVVPSRPEPSDQVIANGNKPSTRRALGILPEMGDKVVNLTVTGVQIGLQDVEPSPWYQVAVRYPVYTLQPATVEAGPG